jgi:hypothetical protein
MKIYEERSKLAYEQSLELIIFINHKLTVVDYKKLSIFIYLELALIKIKMSTANKKQQSFL